MYNEEYEKHTWWSWRCNGWGVPQIRSHGSQNYCTMRQKNVARSYLYRSSRPASAAAFTPCIANWSGSRVQHQVENAEPFAADRKEIPVTLRVVSWLLPDTCRVCTYVGISAVSSVWSFCLYLCLTGTFVGLYWFYLIVFAVLVYW